MPTRTFPVFIFTAMSDPQLVLHQHLLHQSANLCIYFDTASDWIYMEWIGEQDVDMIKTGCEQLLKYLKAERCHKVLNDNSRVTNIWSDAAPWIAREFLPRAEQAGLEYLAWILSPDQFSRLSAEEVLANQETSLIAIPFENYPEAKNWLSSV